MYLYQEWSLHEYDPDQAYSSDENSLSENVQSTIYLVSSVKDPHFKVIVSNHNNITPAVGNHVVPPTCTEGSSLPFFFSQNITYACLYSR